MNLNNPKILTQEPYKHSLSKAKRFLIWFKPHDVTTIAELWRRISDIALFVSLSVHRHEDFALFDVSRLRKTQSGVEGLLLWSDSRLAGTAPLCSLWPVTRCLSSWAPAAHKIPSIIRELSVACKCPGAARTLYQRVYYSKLILSILQGRTYFITLCYHWQAADTFPITGKARWLISCLGRALDTAFKVIKGSEM